MPTPRLQHQFIRLWQSCGGRPADTTLSQLAEVLSCSRRHVRTLLNAMQHEGWLKWEAESGRGKRSRLTFLSTGLEVQQLRAEELMEQDHIEQLVQLVGDRGAVRQMLLSQLGRSFRQGKHILRVLYYRPLFNLLPGTPMRRSETHLARQIFNGLTRLNEENGELESDLAHHWQEITPLHWRFYLRPAIRFHHGRELDMEDVIASLTRLREQPLFSHIKTVTSPNSHVIDIHLLSADRWLPWLLGSIHAMILPREWQNLPDFARHPIGTGPYQVVRNGHSQLKICAFDDYFGLRALIDEVNIWVLPELSEELVHAGVQLQADDTRKDELESRLEEGCYFLLFDQRSSPGRDPAVRNWLCQLISPIALLNKAGKIHQRYWSPAYGVLPRWHHNRVVSDHPKPAGLDSVTLTYYSEHSEFHAICAALRPLLAEYGVRLVEQEIEYDRWHNGDCASDLWLGSANFYLPLEFSLFASLYELPLLHHCLGDELTRAVTSWRANTLSLAEWNLKLVVEHRLHPLFHHWLKLLGQHSMRGVRMNTLGWFDFKSAWFAPPESSAQETLIQTTYSGCAPVK
ncbi:HTH-type transcriptional regulator SgrR [Enterobacillus tribolii]|uniref:SgrR family transcriptional regulator n=1 Tax=Enterobacillus tribolii TaxID=1487935 RepID=A0A370QQ10_9GAMM|nr:HTH-type transcriptional regulator SgrR [Enterobacillus tribolii]MBW7981467.1 HTH-type transcriptional regulator SgrR [Enterobacillus tribolii]RDK90844.1 SgrR family transcriptional regulator [Enterobacillus tribolii]